MLFIIYQSQGVLIPLGSSIGPLLLLLIFLISFIYLVKITISYEGLTNFMKVWIVFFLFPIFSFIFSGDIEAEESMFRQILINFLPFFPSYYFAVKGFFTKKHLVLFSLILLPILSIKFFQSASALQFETGKENVVANSIYPILGLLPFILLIKNKIFSFGVINFIWFLTVQSNKRAAIVIGVIVLLLFLYQNIYLSSKKNKVRNYLVAFLFLIGMTYFAYEFYVQNFYLQERISLMIKGDSSGRDNLFEALFNAWYHSDNFFDYLFGLGFNSSGRLTSNVAHNDWVDIIASYGLMGLLAFLVLWKKLIQQIFDPYWIRSKKIGYAAIIAIALISSMVFRWYSSPFPYMNAVLLPYLLATKYNDE